MISILARNQVGRHRMYPGHYPRIFVNPKNAQNKETKHQSGAVPILLRVIRASTTSIYSSLNVLQESNPQPQLLKASVYHSATSAVEQSVICSVKEGGSKMWRSAGDIPNNMASVCSHINILGNSLRGNVLGMDKK
jgi:hypothetical protein